MSVSQSTALHDSYTSVYSKRVLDSFTNSALESKLRVGGTQGQLHPVAFKVIGVPSHGLIVVKD